VEALLVSMFVAMLIALFGSWFHLERQHAQMRKFFLLESDPSRPVG
jgi:hypothetical protein